MMITITMLGCCCDWCVRLASCVRLDIVVVVDNDWHGHGVAPPTMPRTNFVRRAWCERKRVMMMMEVVVVVVMMMMTMMIVW